MGKIEDVLNALSALTIEELDLVKTKIRELKTTKKSLNKSLKKPQNCGSGIRKSQKEKMINYNPFLAKKL